MPIGGLFKKIFNRRPAAEPDEVDALRLEFRERYHNFKLLLSANNKALEIMGEIEETLRGDRPFGMTFVRAACTSTSVNVFTMIRSLGTLAPVVYTVLFPPSEAIL